MKKFIRRNWDRFSRLGKTRKKLRVWRKPKGRHSKTREKMKGYPAIVEIGYRTEKKTRQKKRKMIYNTKDLESVGKDEIVVLGKVGKKNKIEIAKKAKEMKINIQNLNIRKFLKKAEKKTKEEVKKEEKNKENKK